MTGVPPLKNVTLSVRVSEADFAAIKQRAAAEGLSQGDLIVRAVLGRGDPAPLESLSARVAQLERRLDALERRRKR